MSQPAATRTRRIVSNMALSLASVVVFLGMAEALVRVLKPDVSIPQAEHLFRFDQNNEFQLPHHQRDPELGWRLVPGTYGRMRINREGFRGPELAPARAAVGKRIAHLGDSCTMGFTIADDRQIYSSRLADLLARQGRPMATLNFGVDGYTSHQGRRLLEQVLEAYSPTYVTLYFGYNDHHYSNLSDRETSFGAAGLQSALEHSQAFRFLRRQILLLMRREARLLEPKRRVGLEDFEDNLKTMLQRARSHGAVPILMTTPLRPGRPLIENEVLAQVGGEARWVTQDWWVEQQLARHGLDLQKATGTEVLQQVLSEGLRQYPDWPYLHFLQARELKRRGDEDGAARELARARAVDSERGVMQQYDECVRRLARELEVELIDLARLFEGESQPLFNDVVHPNVAGHQLIARALAEKIEQLESGRAPEPRDSDH